MGANGGYRQGRKKITEPVLRVDPAKVPIMEPDVLQEVKDYLGIPDGSSRPTMFVSKTQTWALGALLAALAVGVVFATYVAVTREYQAEVQQRQLHDIKRNIEQLQRDKQIIERTLVQHETELDNLKDR